MISSTPLVLGTVSRDSVHTANGASHEFWGGGALGVAVGARLAGAWPGLISTVGEDFLEASASLAAAGIDTTSVRVVGRRSTQFEIDYDEGWRLKSVSGTYLSAATELDGVPLPTGSSIYICARLPFRCADLGALLGRLSPSELWMDASLAFLQSSGVELATLLGAADGLLLNAAEYRALLGSVQPDVVAQIPEIVVTDQDAAILVITRSGKHTVPVTPSTVSEATGAGDVFAGAYSWLRQSGRTIPDSATVAAGYAALSLGRPGTLHLLERR